MSDETKPRLAVIAPVFQTADFAAAVAHYRDRLLFTLRFEWSDSDDEPVRYMIFDRNDIELHVTQVAEPTTANAYCFVEGVSDYYALVQVAGANITEELADQPWQMREFEVTDPDGNRLFFGEHLSRIEGTSDG